MTWTRDSWPKEVLARSAQRVAAAASGSRHNQLIGASWEAGDYVDDGTLDRDEVHRVLWDAAERNGLATERPKEARRAIEDGIARGSRDKAWYPQPGESTVRPPRDVHWKGQVLNMSTRKVVPESSSPTYEIPSCAIVDDQVRVTWYSDRFTTKGDAQPWEWAELAEACSTPMPWPATGKDALPLWGFAELEDDDRGRRPDGVDARGKDQKRDPLVHQVWALALDYDDEPSWSLDKVREWWGDVRYVAHTSAHHLLEKPLKDAARPALPRGRVVLALSRPVNEPEYKRVAAWVLASGRGAVGASEIVNPRRCYFVPASAPGGYQSDVNVVDRVLDVDAILQVDVTPIPDDEDRSGPELQVWDSLDLRWDRDRKCDRPERHLTNVCRILRTDTRWAGRLAYCDFSDQLLLDRRGIKDADIPAIVEWIGSTYHLHASAETVRDAVLRVAVETTIHPVREYLTGLTWDNYSRLDQLLSSGFGVADTPDGLTQVIARRWAISCVARILKPGCKVDTVLILFGEQGALKSSAFRALVGDDWFSDSMLDLGDMVRAYMGIRGKWVYELAELDALRARESTTIKSFLSSQVDTYIRKHGRMSESHPRQTVFVGTTNEEAMLRDPTGSRRFWVRKASKPIDLDWLRENRDQLWAEAVAAYRAGEQWWLTPEEDAARRAMEWEHTDDDAWSQAVHHWLVGKDLVTIADIALGALKIEVGDIDARTKNRISAVIRGMGWKSERSRAHGDRTPRWRRPP